VIPKGISTRELREFLDSVKPENKGKSEKYKQSSLANKINNLKKKYAKTV
jgi:hypothetical protein